MIDNAVLILDIHRVCNQRCSYCIAHTTKDGFGPITEKKTLDDLHWLYANFRQANVVFTGGEPLITPNIETIFQDVVDHGHRISLQSNCRVRARTILSQFKPEHFGWILSTFHSVEIQRFPHYLKTISTLRRDGYPIVVKLVLDDVMLEHFETIQDALVANDTPVILAPLVLIPPLAPYLPKRYTQTQWSRISARLALKSSWLYFVGGFKSRGTPCRAGERLLYSTLQDGNIRGCGHGFPSSVGNIYRREFSPESGPIPCGLDTCFCDFHYYCGAIPLVDDTADFAKLLKNPGMLTTQAEYVQWLAGKKITPTYALDELCIKEPVEASPPPLAGKAQTTLAKDKDFPIVPVQKLHEVLGLPVPIEYPEKSLQKDLKDWRMEIDDAPIFRYVYRNLQPRRHLEFGTWQGAGTVYCLQESAATVWTINLPAGETFPDGKPSYWSTESYDLDAMPGKDWAKRIGLREDIPRPSDTLGFIGRFYQEKNLGHRVCQIYCDSTKWDDSNLPDGFFDSALIDGGHSPEVVVSDTKKALRLVRSGGIILWHDFCPPMVGVHEAPRGVGEAIASMSELLASSLSSVFWIYPSWILFGIKR